MTPFFLPLAVPEGTILASRIRQLEQELDIALCLLRTLSERLRAAMGPDVLGPELNRFLAACDPVAQGVIIARLDTLVTQKQESEAVRLFREIFGVTWDQAFDLYAQWSHCDHGQKLRWLRAAELHKVFAPTEDRIRE